MPRRSPIGHGKFSDRKSRTLCHFPRSISSVQRQVETLNGPITISFPRSIYPHRYPNAAYVYYRSEPATQFLRAVRTASKSSRPTSTRFHVAVFRYCHSRCILVVGYNSGTARSSIYSCGPLWSPYQPDISRPGSNVHHEGRVTMQNESIPWTIDAVALV